MENISELHQKLSCFNTNDGYNVLDISGKKSGKKYVDGIKEGFKMNGSNLTKVKRDDLEKIYDYYDEDKYKAAGEMFIYLTLCPKFMFEWKQLYVDLLQNGPPDIIVQTLNRIIAIGIRKKDKVVTRIAKDIFHKITKTLLLQYKSVDKFTKYQRLLNSSIDERVIFSSNLSLPFQLKHAENTTIKIGEYVI